MDRPTLQQLTYLVSLAEHGHFGKAAHACHVSQPGLSNQLRELERRLGCTLVERSPRSVRLTDAGAAIAERARRVLRDVDDMGDVASSAAAGLAGPLRLGVIPTIAPYVVPRLNPCVLDAHPAVELLLTEERTVKLLARLRAGELDVAMMALPVPGADLAHATLANDPFLLAVGSDHPLASVSEVTPSQLSELAVLLLDEGHCLRDQALAVCSAAGTASTSVAATSLSTLVQMVAAGQGVTLLPAIAATVEAHRGSRVAIVPLTDAPQRTLALVWRSSSPRSGLYRELAGLFAPLFQSCAGTRPEPAASPFTPPQDGARLQRR